MASDRDPLDRHPQQQLEREISEERQRRVEEIFARARARMKAEGIKPPTAEEFDEMLGYNELGFFD